MSIAILCNNRLGDGLIFLILANNLQRNGFNVVFYSDLMLQLQPWVPHIKFKSLEQAGDLENIAANHDRVFAEASVAEAFAEQSSPAVVTKLCEPIFIAHSKLATADSTIFSDISRTLPVAEIMAIFCRDILKLTNVTNNNGVVPPSNLIAHKHKNRVIIHATSSKPKKNWSFKKFIKLAAKLQQHNWQPVFIMSAAERENFKDKINNKFPVPVFSTLNELAAFIYESAFMLGNDSGIGHLASCLGVPTLTITNVNLKKGFRWRPGWSCSEVIRPVFKLKLGSKTYWQSFLSVNRVYNAFKKLTAKCKN